MTDNQLPSSNLNSSESFNGQQETSNPSFPQFAPQGGTDNYSPQGFNPTANNGVAADERTVAILAHLAALIAMVVSAGWLTFVGPLVVWFIYKDRSRFVRNAAAGAFNFNLAMTVTTVVAWILCFTIILIPVSIIAFIVVFVMTLVCSIKGALKASDNRLYRYPLGINLLD